MRRAGRLAGLLWLGRGVVAAAPAGSTVLLQPPAASSALGTAAYGWCPARALSASPAWLAATRPGQHSAGEAQQQQQQQQQPPSEWEQQRRAYAAFVAQHGRPPRQKGGQKAALLPGEQQLAWWATVQRRRQRGKLKPPLSAAQQAALEEIPDWFWGPQDIWHQKQQLVLAFVERYGALPRIARTEDAPLLPGEHQLGKWCSTQRQRRKGMGSWTPLSAEQAAALEALPGWFWDVSELWERQRQALTAFAEQHGRLPREWRAQQTQGQAEEHRLWAWCKTQRRRLRGTAQPPLSAEQQAALEAVPGWFWEGHQPWQDRLQAVAAFVAQHGRLPRQNAGQRSPLLAGERLLGHWCVAQRQRRKGRGVLVPLLAEQAAALEALPGWYWDRGVPLKARLQQV